MGMAYNQETKQKHNIQETVRFTQTQQIINNSFPYTERSQNYTQDSTLISPGELDVNHYRITLVNVKGGNQNKVIVTALHCSCAQSHFSSFLKRYYE